MSRSNSPATPKTGWPSSRHPGHDQDQQAATQQGQQWPQQNGQPAAQGYRQQAPQGYAPAPNGGWQGQQQNYHVPQQNNGYGQQQYDQQYAGQRQPAYPPQPAHHNQAPHNHAHGHDNGYTPTLDPYQPAGQQPAYGNGHDATDYSGYGHHREAPTLGYDQWQGQQQQQHAAPDGYDLGSYMPNSLNGADPAATMANEWALNQGYPAHHAGHPDDELYDADGYAQPRTGALAQSYAEDEYQEEDYEEEPPRRRGRMILVLSALIGAIGVGGALAYGYNSLLGPNPSSGEPPVIKSDAGPAKSKPADPGGKQFSYTDSKVMGRLGDNSTTTTTTGSVPDSSDDDSDGGTRRVQTVVVGRDGSISQPTPPPSSGQHAAVSVPGLTLTDGFGRSQERSRSDESPRAEAPPAKPIVVTPPSSPQKPVVIAKAEQNSKARSDANDDYGARAAPPPKKPAKKVVTAAVSPSAPASAGTSGYVAVLASVPASSSSRLDALKRFADMQQQYGDALQNKTPDVQEANLGERGVYHRLVVGPPGSRESANSVCSELKTAGYTNCWVLAY